MCAGEEPLLDIGEVRRRSGVAASALRFYEEHGLIESAGRMGLRRQYTPDTLDRLGVILLCQRGGFSLAEIAELFGAGAGSTWRQLVRRKLDATRRQAAALDDIADGLEHAQGCPSPDVMRCEHFRGILADTLTAHAAGEDRGLRASVE